MYSIFESMDLKLDRIQGQQSTLYLSNHQDI